MKTIGMTGHDDGQKSVRHDTGESRYQEVLVVKFYTSACLSK